VIVEQFEQLKTIKNPTNKFTQKMAFGTAFYTPQKAA
jgi:hypothetical protein